ncbi:hypothetical protein [Streptacidiphilus sp. MAP12-33]|uniref:hypothetical protein n=1 Tax=Streptacidiphilus sp. MAP12-33 TaxID=3156266 RepID=UPI0035170D2E
MNTKERVAAAAAAGLLLALTAGCTGTQAPTARPSGTVAAGHSGPAVAPTPSASGALSVSSADLQLLDDYTTTYERVGDQSGSEQFAEIPRVAPGTVGVSARCSGTGTISVVVSGVVSFDVRCGDPAGDNVDFASSDPRTDVRAQVVSHTTGRWAFGLGWRPGTGQPPQDQSTQPTVR